MAEKVKAAERTRQAIAAADAGDIADARALLAEALGLDPEYQLAWLWFAAVTEDPAEEKFCLERVRDIDPEHQVSPALGRLKDVDGVCPPELTPIIDPPPPQFVSGYVEQARARRRRRLWTRVLAAALVLAVLAGIVALAAASRVKYTYLAVVVSDNAAGQLGGQEMTRAAQWAVDAWNRDRATSSTQVRMVSFTDGGDPANAKQVAQQIVDDGRFVGVIGHATSETSIAAAPVYAAAGIPVVTPSATADSVTADNPWYFRTIFDNSQQGRGMAIYASPVLKHQRVTVVSSQGDYGQTLHTSFVDAFHQLGSIAGDFVISADPKQLKAELARVAQQIAGVTDPEAIVLLTGDPKVGKLAPLLAERGVTVPFVGSDALATPVFYRGLLPAGPSMVNDSITATPLTEGTLTGAAVTFYDEFAQAQGYAPGWTAGLTYDAVEAFAEAMVAGDIPWGQDDVATARTRIRDVFAAARTAETAIPVLTGVLYFNADHAAVRPVAFEDGHITGDKRIVLTSAAYQLAPYAPTVGLTLPQEIRDGTAVSALGDVYTVQRVVTTGFNINQLEALDASAQTFTADFFIWFKFQGSPDEVHAVQFVNAIDPNLPLGELQRVAQTGGETYELYRVRGKFRTQMDFADFPFDSQRLPIFVQNKSLPASKITYVTDPDNLAQTQEQRLESGVNVGATIDQIPNWEADAVQFFPATVGSSGDLGDPTFAPGSGGITFSQMVSTTLISRDVTSFLIKNLLPLILLAIVTYVALWYPFKDATARISFGVTGILTGAVMLNSVTSSLPAVDYTVAIGWAYYAFILLSGLCIIGTLFGRQFLEKRQMSRVRTLDGILRVGYPLFILGVVAIYVVRY